jgi:hypothetical protein
VLRGSGCFAIEEEKEMSELASTDARQRQLRFIARCLAVRGEAVKWEGDRSDKEIGIGLMDKWIIGLVTADNHSGQHPGSPDTKAVSPFGCHRTTNVS